jgi:hypothetical protein
MYKINGYNLPIMYNFGGRIYKTGRNQIEVDKWF